MHVRHFSLPIFLLAMGIFYILIILIGYTFVASLISGVLLNVLTSVIVIWLTITGIKSREEQTNVNEILSAFCLSLLFSL